MSLDQILVRMLNRIDRLERRAESMMAHGTVAQVDPAKGRVRLRLGGSDDKPFLSPWIPYAQIAGALKVHTPPSVGQQMTAISPCGDLRQACALPMTFSEANASPSQSGEENVVTYGGFRLTLKGDALIVEGPKVVVDSPNVQLGGEGGKPVARVGDNVHVLFGSSAGLHPIVEGSSRVNATD